MSVYISNWEAITNYPVLRVPLLRTKIGKTERTYITANVAMLFPTLSAVVKRTVRTKRLRHTNTHTKNVNATHTHTLSLASAAKICTQTDPNTARHQ